MLKQLYGITFLDGFFKTPIIPSTISSIYVKSLECFPELNNSIFLFSNKDFVNLKIAISGLPAGTETEKNLSPVDFNLNRLE